ncbi:MAG: ankyrin repeat domain-containing protein [Spirochaetaceae bacterium]|jgi:hypothetical protein|nr:ankyrin repeat domain-containing protein [Spirochaetaceae bacterium]
MTIEALLKNPLKTQPLTQGEEKQIEQAGLQPFELLILACRCDSLSLAQQAIDQGAQVNRRDYESWTPLMHASYHNSWKVIPLLIKYRAVPHFRDDQGDSALDIARSMDSQHSLDEFKESLNRGRLKQAGLFLQTMIILRQEYQKPQKLQSPQTLALCYIDLGYGWWLSEERLDKCFYYFKKAAHLHPKTGAFPYASLLCSCGYREEALSWLFKIAKRRWGSISLEDLQNNQAFFILLDEPQWQDLIKIWPR